MPRMRRGITEARAIAMVSHQRPVTCVKRNEAAVPALVPIAHCIDEAIESDRDRLGYRAAAGYGSWSPLHCLCDRIHSIYPATERATAYQRRSSIDHWPKARSVRVSQAVLQARSCRENTGRIWAASRRIGDTDAHRPGAVQRRNSRAGRARGRRPWPAAPSGANIGLFVRLERVDAIGVSQGIPGETVAEGMRSAGASRSERHAGQADLRWSQGSADARGAGRVGSAWHAALVAH